MLYKVIVIMNILETCGKIKLINFFLDYLKNLNNLIYHRKLL